jgi:hypothetical protein
MIVLCSSFDQVVKTKLTHGGKVLHFPMLNSTNIICVLFLEKKQTMEVLFLIKQATFV